MSGFFKLGSSKSVQELLASDFLVGVRPGQDNIKITYKDLFKLLQLGASVGGGAPLFFTGNNLPSEDNEGQPVAKGNWVLLFEGSYTNVGGGSAVVIPAGKLGFAIFDGVKYVLSKTVDLPVGATILNGSGAPAAGLGKIGDFYLDTTSTMMYGAKTSAGWGIGISLKGSNGKTIEPFNPTKTGGYTAGDSVYFSASGSKKSTYVVLTNAAMGESPATHPSKFEEVGSSIELDTPSGAVSTANVSALLGGSLVPEIISVTELPTAGAMSASTGLPIGNANIFISDYIQVGIYDSIEYRGWNGWGYSIVYLYELDQTPVRSIVTAKSDGVAGGILHEGRASFTRAGLIRVSFYKNAGGSHPANDFTITITRRNAQGTILTTERINQINESGVTSFRSFLQAVGMNDLTSYHRGLDFVKGSSSIRTNGTIDNSGAANSNLLSGWKPIKNGETIYVFGQGRNDNSNVIALYSEKDASKFIKGTVGTNPLQTSTSFSLYLYQLTNDTGADGFVRMWSRTAPNQTIEDLQSKIFYYYSYRNDLLPFPKSDVDLLVRQKANSTFNKGAIIHDFYGVKRFEAHRGFRGFGAVENTRDSIYDAKKVGFKFVELDVQLTSDGYFVIMHNTTINATMRNIDGSEISGNVSVGSTTLQNLKDNYKYKKAVGEDDERIYTLEECLKDLRDCGIYPTLEFKVTLGDARCTEVVKIISKYIDVRKVAFSTGNTNDMKKLRELCPFSIIHHGIGSMYSVNNLFAVKEYNLTVGSTFSAVNKVDVDYFHNMGAKISIYGDTNLDVYNRGLEAGSDTFMVDNYFPVEQANGRLEASIHSLHIFSAYTIAGGTISRGQVNLSTDGTITVPPINNPTKSGVLEIEMKFIGTINVTGGGINHTFTNAVMGRKVWNRIVVNLNEPNIAVVAKCTAGTAIVDEMNVQFKSF